MDFKKEKHGSNGIKRIFFPSDVVSSRGSSITNKYEDIFGEVLTQYLRKYCCIMEKYVIKARQSQQKIAKAVV